MHISLNKQRGTDAYPYVYLCSSPICGITMYENSIDEIYIYINPVIICYIVLSLCLNVCFVSHDSSFMGGEYITDLRICICFRLQYSICLQALYTFLFVTISNFEKWKRYIFLLSVFITNASFKITSHIKL